MSSNLAAFPTAGNVLPKSRDGLATALRALGWEWRYNTRSHRAELRARGEEWREGNDRLIADIRAEIPLRFKEAKRNKPLAFGRTAFEDSFAAVLFHSEVDPFQAWLEALPAWDGEARLDGWLSRVFDVEAGQEALAAWCSRFLPLGAVWRTFKPGTKLDEMPVLIGVQGCGKSTALRALLPPEKEEWFSDGLRLAADDKVRAEALQGRVIVEAAEMAGSTRAERESLKAFLSRTNDGSVRLAYRRDPETMRRRCVMAGTTNDSHCLPTDPSGNRRFVALNVRSGQDGAAGVRAYLADARGQIWAEALRRYHAGEVVYLPADLITAQTAANAGAVSVDESLEDELLRFLDGREEPFRIKDLRGSLVVSFGGDRPSDKRLGVELQRLGCDALGLRQIRGERGRWWNPPVPF